MMINDRSLPSTLPRDDYISAVNRGRIRRKAGVFPTDLVRHQIRKIPIPSDGPLASGDFFKALESLSPRSPSNCLEQVDYWSASFQLLFQTPWFDFSIVRGQTLREIDNPIYQMIEKALKKTWKIRPLRVLEIGAGGTFHRDHLNTCYGVPTLSRALALMYPGRLQIIASDFHDLGQVYGLRIDRRWGKYKTPYITNEKELCNCPVKITPSSLLKLKPRLTDLAGTPTLVPLTWPDIEQRLTKDELESLRKELERSYLGQNVLQSDELFCAQTLDPWIESALFGLYARSNVDFMNLRQSFPSITFDIVFSRFLEPWVVNKFPQLEASVRSVLAPGGEALIDIEGKTERITT